jgi:hypothetical protein
MEDNKLELLKESLQLYKEKWEHKRTTLDKKEDDIRYHVKLTSMIYMAQWIINSINGGLDKPHGTNICNILRENN